MSGSSLYHNPKKKKEETKRKARYDLNRQRRKPTILPIEVDSELSAARNDVVPESKTDTPHHLSTIQRLRFLERFLVLWIFLAMAGGLLLGYYTDFGEKLQSGEIVGVSIPIGIGLLVMMHHILCKVQYEALHELVKIRSLYIHLSFSLLVNWIFAPLLMLALAFAFLTDKPEHREGLILVGIARCITMVLIWTDLAGGDVNYCAMLVALNSLLQIIVGVPVVNVEISYPLVSKSVAVFLGIPLAAAVITRFGLIRLIGMEIYKNVFLKYLGPWSLIGLLFTIVVLFASQSKNFVGNIVSVLRVAAPLTVYFFVIFTACLASCRVFGRFGKSHDSEGLTENTKRRRSEWGYGKSVTQSLTAASNNFELAIAVAVASYGPGSAQALASSVGPLIEVPGLLALVEVAKYLGKKWNWEF